MAGKAVIIRKGISLSDISQKWIYKNSANISEFVLTYTDDLKNRNLKICFITKIKEKEYSECKYIVNNYNF